MKTNISINEYLLDELLIEIFTYLSPQLRIQSHLVCRKWLNLLRTSPKFKKDRKLYFNDCLLNDQSYPANIFISSDVQYNSIKFGINCILTEACDELNEKFKNISALDISLAQGYKMTKELARMMSFMRNLKVLTVENQDSLLKVDEEYWLILDLKRMFD
uniref:CSON013136 protein n=1 Tax=Culicoides sonorensis TaxID=179676 RepID=A0A336KP08_CULSO